MHIFDTDAIRLQVLNVSATMDFPSLCVKYISISLSCNHDFINLLENVLPLSTKILFGVRSDSSNISLKTLVIVIISLFLKGSAPAFTL